MTIGKIGHIDHSSPEVSKLNKLLVHKHLITELGGQNIPACAGF